MAKNTRLATTITARYLQGAGAIDAFYLDGRMNGFREQNFADISLDREDRGAFFAVYASSHGSQNASTGEDGNKELLSRVSQDLKQNNRQKIDQAINDLAECAVSVTGRLTLADKAELQPYFSGIIVKDGEIAAVTLGRACAYLYRDDALFPLTQDDLGFEAVDYYGKTLPNMDDFSAGVAGTIRYSNIAQLKANDCIILCNREVMEIVGQHRMLQLLDQAEDQSDAAGMVMGLCTHENQQANLQFMIGFVEDLIPLDRLGRSTLARGFAKLSRETGMMSAARNTGRMATQQSSASAVPVRSGTAAASKSGLFSNFDNADAWHSPEPSAPVAEPALQRSDMADRGGYHETPRKSAAETVPGESPAGGANSGVWQAESAHSREMEHGADEGSVEEVRPQAAEREEGTAGEARPPYRSEESETSARSAYFPAGGAYEAEHEDTSDDEAYQTDMAQDERVESRFAAPISGQSLRDEEEFPETQPAPAQNFSWGRDPVFDDEVAAEEPQPAAERKPRKMNLQNKGGTDRGRKIALIVLIIIALLLVAFIGYTLLTGKPANQGEQPSPSSPIQVYNPDVTPTPQANPSVTPEAALTPAPSQDSVPTSDPNVAPTDPNTGAGQQNSDQSANGERKYIIREGDTMWAIVRKQYQIQDDAEIYDMIPLVEEANPDLDLDALHAGDEIILPKRER